MAPEALVVVAPSAIVMDVVSAVTVTVPVPPVAIAPAWVRKSAFTPIVPSVELIVVPAAWVSPPVVAARAMLPRPWAVTAELMVKLPASTVSVTLPLAASVRTPVPTIVSAFVSCRTMSPETVFVAVSVPTSRSRSASPAPPMPVLAVSVSRPLVLTFKAASAAGVKSAIAPSAIRVTLPPALLVILVRVIVPAPVVVTFTLPEAVVIWSIWSASVSVKVRPPGPVSSTPLIVRGVESVKISPARVACPIRATVVRTLMSFAACAVKRSPTRRPWVCVIAPPRARSTIEEVPAAVMIAVSAAAELRMMLPVVSPAASSMRRSTPAAFEVVSEPVLLIVMLPVPVPCPAVSEIRLSA